jgi:hypothetical protein
MGWRVELSQFIFLEDTTGLVGIIFRFIAGIIAISSVVFYFSKGLPSTEKTYKIMKCILVFEAIYWLSFLTVTVFNVDLVLSGLARMSTISLLSEVAWTTFPILVESIVLPIALLILASKLSPNNPINKAIKWGLITSVIYIVVFWLTNTGMWMITLRTKGTQYLTSYPENLLSFILTLFGLLALAIYAGYFARKSSRIQTLQELNLKSVGGIITALGMYFLWNYLTWIFFGGNYLWSSWYAWFLGHNLDLWMLSLPLLGLPLLFIDKLNKK